MYAIPTVSNLSASPVTSSQVASLLSSGQSATRLANSTASLGSAATISSQAVLSTATASSSSVFFAQLLGQDSSADTLSADDSSTDSLIALATANTQFAPATEYNRLVAYSYVKYKPSDAGLQGADIPLDQVSLPAATVTASSTGQNDNAVPITVANDYQAYSNTQSRNQAGLLPASSTLRIAG